MAEQTEIQMVFLTSDSKKFTIRVDDPRSDLNPLDIKQVMDIILEKNVLNCGEGKLTELHSANLVTVTTNPMDSEW